MQEEITVIPPRIRERLARSMRRISTIVVSFAVAISVISSATVFAQQQRIVAIGDVHGAYAEFTFILRRVNLIDNENKWIGGQSTLVQTGDVVDRGADGAKCYDLLMALEGQAKSQGGSVIVLLGNHEIMTMTHDLRYVSPQDYTSFATAQSEQVRQKAYHEYLQFLSLHEGKDPTELDTNELRQRWMSAHPLGYFERQDAFGPEGTYGRWLRKLPGAISLENVGFVHGGIDPHGPVKDFREITNQVHLDLKHFDELWQSLSQRKAIWNYMQLQESLTQVGKMARMIRHKMWPADYSLKTDLVDFQAVPNWLICSPNGPLWYRGLAVEPDARIEPLLGGLFKRLKISYLVVGHTVQPKFDITSRFNHRVFLIDTGMMREAYQGRPSALEIVDGHFEAIYSDETPILVWNEKEQKGSAEVPSYAGTGGEP